SNFAVGGDRRGKSIHQGMTDESGRNADFPVEVLFKRKNNENFAQHQGQLLNPFWAARPDLRADVIHDRDLALVREAGHMDVKTVKSDRDDDLRRILSEDFFHLLPGTPQSGEFRHRFPKSETSKSDQGKEKMIRCFLEMGPAQGADLEFRIALFELLRQNPPVLVPRRI